MDCTDKMQTFDTHIAMFLGEQGHAPYAIFAIFGKYGAYGAQPYLAKNMAIWVSKVCISAVQSISERKNPNKNVLNSI